MQNQSKQQRKLALNHAIKVVHSEVVSLGERLKTAEGEERTALEQEIAKLMGAIGMQYTGEASITEMGNVAANTTGDIAEGVGAGLLSAIRAGTASLEMNFNDATVEHGADVKIDVEVKKPSLWQRFKNFCADNKVLVSGAAVATVAAIGGVVYFYNAKNTGGAVSSVSGVTEVTVEPSTPETGDTTIEAGTTVFTRVGDWVVFVLGTAKGYLVAAWNWLAGAFSKPTNTEVVVEPTPEATVAAA